MKFLSAIFNTRAQRAHDRYMREIEAVERVTVATLEAASAEDLGEQLAAEKLRSADLQRRLVATLAALDKERDANEERRIADLNNEKEGPKRDLEKFNDAQAARAMSRNTKQAFVVYQGAVKMILDRLDTLGKGNHVTKEDLRKLRQLREDLSAQIQRTI